MLIGPEKSLGDEQSRMNDSTRGQWDWYAAHRRQIERLIVPEARGGRICVLGAGNCNDLDLRWLTEVYGEVHLVDIDRASLDRAVKKQGVKGDRIFIHAPVDLTGVADRTRGWAGRTVSDAEVDEAMRSAAGELPLIGGGSSFDVVLSPCVLSQLLCGVRDLLGRRHPAWPRLKEQIRARHLRTIVGMLKPGGSSRGAMVVDLASSKRVTGLERAKEDEAAGIMEMCVRDGKCFHGLEPRELIAGLRRAGAVGPVTLSTPWVWHLGLAKAFLCYGLTVRSAGVVGGGG
jgi:hypothetical protein